MTADNTVMSAPRLLVYRLIGAAVVGASTGACTWLGTLYPWAALILHGANTGIAWYVGKLLGAPMDAVVSATIAAMHPDRAAMVATDALRSLPPETAADVTRSLLRSIPPEFARAMIADAPDLTVAPDGKKTAPGG